MRKKEGGVVTRGTVRARKRAEASGKRAVDPQDVSTWGNAPRDPEAEAQVKIAPSKPGKTASQKKMERERAETMGETRKKRLAKEPL
jgi:hypothetical protein